MPLNLTYRDQLTRNLTPAEVDANFRAIAAAINALTGTTPLPVPTISFTQIGDKQVGSPEFTLAATSTNTGVPIVFTTSDASHIAITTATNPGKATVGSVGTAVVTASQAAGNGFAAAVSVSQTIAVSVPVQPTPTITFGQPANHTVGDAPFDMSASSTNSVTPITFTSSNTAIVTVAKNGSTWQATVVGAGTVTITANQVAGNGYAAASLARTLTVAAAPPSFNRTVSATLPADSPGTLDGIVFVPASTQKLRFIGNANTSGATLSLQITDSSDNSVSYVSIPDDYKNTQFAFDRANGTTYLGTVPTTDSNFTA